MTNETPDYIMKWLKHNTNIDEETSDPKELILKWLENNTHYDYYPGKTDPIEMLRRERLRKLNCR